MNSITLSEERDEGTCYDYCNEYQPHAVKCMFDYNDGMLYDMRWDEAGNLGQVSMAKPGEMFETGRFLFWTEDSRMHAAVDDKHYSYYAYDHSGQRRLKLVGDNCSMDVNAEYMTAVSTLNEPTLYPSAYMVLTNKGYTKHYYAGTERVAARLGGGGLDAQQHLIANDDDLQWKADRLFKQSLEHVNYRVLHENDLDCIMQNEFSKEEFGYWIDDIPYQMKADVKFDHDQFKDMVNSMLTDYHNGEEKEVYFYHSDHLGSASWITDSIGIPIQHLQYLPYGEPYIDQRAAGTTYSERFTFTGKERDEETGYGYFGARYMDHELMTMWLSIDPMADKYPSISPYAYCAWNPVRLVDPDGKEVGDYYNFNGVYLGWDGSNDDKVYIVDDSKGGYKKDALGRIDRSSVSPEITTTYSALEAVQGVYGRTLDNKGKYEESAFVIGGNIIPESVKGPCGYYDNYGNPHCNPPVLTEEQKMLSGLGLTSVHSHPFELVYGILDNSYRTSVPSSNDKELFKSCNMNIIVGYLSNITNPSETYPQTTENIGATFYSSSFEKMGSVKMSSINKIVRNKQNARGRHNKNTIKWL